MGIFRKDPLQKLKIPALPSDDTILSTDPELLAARLHLLEEGIDPDSGEEVTLPGFADSMDASLALADYHAYPGAMSIQALADIDDL